MAISYSSDLKSLVGGSAHGMKANGYPIIKNTHGPKITDHGALVVDDFSLSGIKDRFSGIVARNFNIILWSQVKILKIEFDVSRVFVVKFLFKDDAGLGSGVVRVCGLDVGGKLFPNFERCMYIGCL